MRSSGRARSRPLRSVSRQSSPSTVLMPVSIASCSWRTSCTCARARSLVIQPVLSSGAAILPSSVSADFSVTSGLPVRMKWKKARFSRRASSANSSASTTSTPASRSRAKPLPATSGFGSSVIAITRRMPARRMASTHGGVRPWCAHGSSVTYRSAPRAASPASSSAITSACFTPAHVWNPRPTTRPSCTTTAPTAGLGDTRPKPWRARSSAARIHSGFMVRRASR